jgi:chromosome segregation ATPase
MHQIDILLSNKNCSQVEGLKRQLQSRDRDLASTRVSLREKTSEVEKLHEELDQLRRQLKVKSSDHETQLLRLRSELNRLTKSYDKLKGRRPKPSAEGPPMKVDSQILMDTVIEVQKQCDVYEEQLKQNSDSLRELEKINRLLEENVFVKEREIDEIKVSCEKMIKEHEDKVMEKEEHYKNMFMIKDSKIDCLKKERNDSRLQAKSAIAESEKWYKQLQELLNQNKGLKAKIDELTAQKGQQDNILISQKIIELQEKLSVKDTTIRDMEKQFTKKLREEELHHQQELQTLQMTLKTLTNDLQKMKEENRHLKKKFEIKTSSPIQHEMKKELDKRECELNDYRAQLINKDSLVQSLQERVSSLEEALSEATSELNESEGKSHNSSLHSDDKSHNHSRQSHDQSHGKSHKVISIKESLVDEFQQKLSHLMSQHLTTIDHSIHKALDNHAHSSTL